MWWFVLWEWDVMGRLGFMVLLTNAEKVWQHDNEGWLFALLFLTPVWSG